MSSSETATATGSAAAATTSAAATISVGSNLKVVGIVLALVSGVLIGSSFVFKKKGLLGSQAVHGEGVAYLKSPLWWTGMIMMILGEICNFAAYAFVEALVVTPLGALSVVVCAILSSIFLKETLSFFGWLGCALCIVGSTIIALNGPKEASVGQITQFQKLFLAPGFVSFTSVLIVTSLSIIFYFGPKYGKNSMLWYIAVCSMIGGISVSVTTGLGAAIVTTAMGDNQFKHWFIYFLLVFVVTTLITEVYYLNMALALFNTAMVTPTYYVIFTFCSMVTTVVLFQGLKASATQIITIVMAFFTICIGITILQMSKVDPTSLTKLDRRTTILLQAARQNTAAADEKSVAGFEDPGIDALRGSFGALGSIMRANTTRRMSRSSGGTSLRNRASAGSRPYDIEADPSSLDKLAGMTRHQLYDAPVPRDPDSIDRASSIASSRIDRRPTIKFDSQDVVHQYHPTGKGDTSTHAHRDALHGYPYPPMPNAQGHTSPSGADISDSNLVGDGMRQTITMSPRRNSDPRTAPPVLDSSYFRPLPKDPFENTPATTLSSTFPSASDSSDNHTAAPWYSNDETKRAKGHRYGRSYPKGEDDKDESVSLWSGELEEEDGPRNPGGIRLVKPSSDTRF